MAERQNKVLRFFVAPQKQQTADKHARALSEAQTNICALTGKLDLTKRDFDQEQRFHQAAREEVGALKRDLTSFATVVDAFIQGTDRIKIQGMLEMIASGQQEIVRSLGARLDTLEKEKFQT